MQVLAKGRRFLRFADSLYLGVLHGTLDKRLWRGHERTIADTQPQLQPALLSLSAMISQYFTSMDSRFLLSMQQYKNILSPSGVRRPN